MMKIVEVRDGFVKIESDKKIEVSSFLELKGLAKRYIAQVMRSKSNGMGYNIYAKILFIYDGMLRKYDKTMPDNSAEVSEFSYETVNNSFNYSNPIVAGKFISNNSNILIDSATFNNSMLISVDTPEMNNILVQNITKQLKQLGKVVVIDMLGVLDGDKYVAGRDFRLPLNTESLKFIYDDCLSDATADSKSLIKEIFTDLVEYSKEVNFLPFITLKTIVDDMVEKSHIFKLLVLKNKLAKFDTAGYFASTEADAKNLSKLLNSDYVIIDLSKVDSLFQNRYLSLILSELENTTSKSNVFAEVSNAISKKNIKTLLYSDKINSTFITHSKFKYLADIKSLFKNFIIEKSYSNKDIFDLYSFFIEPMEANNYLIVGEATNYVPLISKLEKYDVKVKTLPQDAISEEVLVTNYDSQVTEEIPDLEQELEANSDIENLITETELSEEIAQSIAINESYTDTELSDVSDSAPVQEEISELSADDSNEEQIEEIDDIIISDEESVTINSIFDEEISDNAETSDNTNSFEQVTEAAADDESFCETTNDEPIIDNEEYSQEITEELSEESLSDNLPELSYESDEPVNDNEEIELSESENDVEIPIDLANDFDELEQTDAEESEIGIMESDEQFEPRIVPLENQEEEIGEFEELDNIELTDIDEETVLVELDEEINLQDSNGTAFIDEEEPISAETIDKDIVEDVDKVFTTMREDSISESDLDLIDTLNDFDSNLDETQSEDEFFTNNDAETLQEFESEDEQDGFLEPLEEVSDSNKHAEPEKEILETKEGSTPIVPIYDAGIPDEDKVISDDIEQGDTVVHAKYGSGVVEKMIKYGSKNLYSINFDNVGRRLLDPTLTEIKKA